VKRCGAKQRHDLKNHKTKLRGSRHGASGKRHEIYDLKAEKKHWSLGSYTINWGREKGFNMERQQQWVAISTRV